jgi:hypothetical protein
MKDSFDDLISHNAVFGWVALATGLILLIPLIAMQLTTEVQWDETDFFVMGVLIFGVASSFILIARRISRKHRLLAGRVFLMGFFYIWAELAVGIFTNLGS